MIFKLGDVMANIYNTKQKDIILDVIKSQNREFTVKDIYKQVSDKAGLTTIYRLIDKLEKDGLISKDIGLNNITYYQYLEKCDEENHFYLKCGKCGNMIHVDCDCINDLSNHIKNIHKFSLNKENIVINGICNRCNEKRR